MISRLAGIVRRIVVRRTAVRRAPEHGENDADPDRPKTLAMPGLQQEGDDGADDEDRLEAFAQDDQERLPERLDAAAGRRREREHGRHVAFDLRLLVLGGANVVAADRRLEAGVGLLHRRDQTRILRSRSRLDGLEPQVGIGGAVDGIIEKSTSRGAQRLLEKTDRRPRRAGGVIGVGGNRDGAVLVNRQRAQVRDDRPLLLHGERRHRRHRRSGHAVSDDDRQLRVGTLRLPGE